MAWRAAALLAIVSISDVVAIARNRDGSTIRGRLRSTESLALSKTEQNHGHHAGQGRSLVASQEAVSFANLTAAGKVPENIMQSAREAIVPHSERLMSAGGILQSVAYGVREAVTHNKIGQLDAWENRQPFDTVLGSHFLPGLSDPASTPKRSNVALGCPSLMPWPDVVEVRAPDPCNSNQDLRDRGSWSSEGKPLVSWATMCGIVTPNLAPVASYSLANGDFFGMSRTEISLTGTKVAIMDCHGQIRYTIEEKVYHKEGKVDKDSCDKYSSCDGTVYIQYFLAEADGRIIAKTPLLKIFDASFIVMSMQGKVIASVERDPQWLLATEECNGAERKWTIRYTSDGGGVFPSSADSWPIASLVTVMTLRDGFRRSNGLLRPSACEIAKTVSFIILSHILLGLALVGAYMFRTFLLNRVRLTLVQLESRICPNRMRLPSKYERH